MPRVTYVQSAYAPDSVGIGIVHIGLGAFHRAHQAVYLERWLNRNGGGDFGICAANIRSNRAIVDVLAAQSCRYHVVEYQDNAHARVRQVNAIRQALFARDDKRALLDRMTAPGTRIVSLTVTEKGYYLSPSSGTLLADHPDVVHDLADSDDPRTAPGLLLAALERRRGMGVPPFTVLCCDNMPDNGRRTCSAVAALAEARSAELADWIRSEVAFPSTMVDRIVPAASAASRAKLAALIGQDDAAAIACEAFSQWVVEDRFPLGRPDWEPEGVEMVADVRPYETMKLRLLNGSHSLLAYLGLAHGKTTVAEAIAYPPLRDAVLRYLAEAAASLETDGLDTAAYTTALLERFDNDALEHRLTQIAMDGSQKLPQRWLEGALANVEEGRSVSATAGAVAAWARYVRGRDDDGKPYVVDDPMAERLARCHAGRFGRDAVDALLFVRDIFPERLARHEPFRRAVHDAYARLTDRGAA